MKPYFKIVFFLILVNTMDAQDVVGVILDENTFPIENATIYINGGDVHCHSNHNGIFKLKQVNIGDTLHVSHIAYKTEQITIREKDYESKLTIELEEQPINLSEVSIKSTRNLQRNINKLDIQNNPLQNSQEILTMVPGALIGQHAGGGKAEQIFLRGFDLDHGTDINISVDNVPVNMVSHAHGQGYSDMHFVIPETVEDIKYGKGPYSSMFGNFHTAGYAQLSLKNRLRKNTFRLEGGSFNTLRGLLMSNIINEENRSMYISGEYMGSDGPFEASQGFTRLNLMARYHQKVGDNQFLTFTGSHFNSEWDASGQIPLRAVENGSITRFGAIDPTEGGVTSRQNLSLLYRKIIDNNQSLEFDLYASKYDFLLYSNFTFFLRDSINGDQIRQKEDRTLYGFNTSYKFNKDWTFGSLFSQIRLGIRHDDISDNELSYTKNRRTTLENVQLGDVDETNSFVAIQSDFSAGPWEVSTGLRVDLFQFTYRDQLQPIYSLQSQQHISVNPNLSFSYNVHPRLSLYGKIGSGFHSNDTRVIISDDVDNALPRAIGYDIGIASRVLPSLFFDLAFWQLNSAQEFVYVGDEGIVEPSNASTRRGVDFSLRFNPFNRLSAFTNISYSNARSSAVDGGREFIPLAVPFIATSGVQYNMNGLTVNLNHRIISDRPANEDNSIVAHGYSIFDLKVNYKLNERINLGFQILNLLDTDWEETQFATLSRLKNETVPVEEIHFTPGAPRMFKGSVSYHF